MDEMKKCKYLVSIAMVSVVNVNKYQSAITVFDLIKFNPNIDIEVEISVLYFR